MSPNRTKTKNLNGDGASAGGMVAQELFTGPDHDRFFAQRGTGEKKRVRNRPRSDAGQADESLDYFPQSKIRTIARGRASFRRFVGGRPRGRRANWRRSATRVFQQGQSRRR